MFKLWTLDFLAVAVVFLIVQAPLLASAQARDLHNISTRGPVLTGDNVMIGGFIIAGSTPKTVLVRARGPSMGDPPFNVPGILANPLLQIFSGQMLIAQNDDWQVTDPLCGVLAISCGGVTEIRASGLDPCQPNPGQSSAPTGCAQESAAYISLPPGPYTAIMRGSGGGTGIGLVEVFEVGITTSKLVNISTRGRVETGDNVMIGGFIIGGSTPKSVLVRARGPSMGDPPFHVPGILANPVLQIFSGQTLIAQNNDWQVTDPLCGSPAISCGGVTEIRATSSDPCRPNPGQTGPPTDCGLESAILITLPPGAYTAIVRGFGAGTGVGLVEVFDVLEYNLALLEGKLKSLAWLAYAPTNFDPTRGCPHGFPPEEGIRADLELAYSHGFRGLITFAADCTLEAIPRVARELGFHGVIMGLFLFNDVLRREEIENARRAAEHVDGYGIGNEGLIGCGGTLYTSEMLLEIMEEIRGATQKPVTTSEQIEDYLDGGCLEGYLLANGDWLFPITHPFNNGIADPQAGVDFTEARFERLSSITNKTVFFKETGWPTGGHPAATEENQETYFVLLKGGPARYAYFEGFDQPWKPTDPLPWERSWGLFRPDRTPKRFIENSEP